MLLRIVHRCTTDRALLPGGANRLCQRPLGPEPGSFPPPQEWDLNVTAVRSGVTATGYEDVDLAGDDGAERRVMAHRGRGALVGVPSGRSGGVVRGARGGS